MRKFLAGSVLLGLALVINAPSALANTLVSTNPIAGSTLKVSPSAITITTEKPLMDIGNEITVVDPTGKRVDDGTLTVGENMAVLGMKQLTVAGIYTVAYTLLAEGDVPLEGEYRFTYSAVVASPIPSESVSPTAEKVSSSDFATNLFVIGLMCIAIIVLIFLSLYARKLYVKK